MTNPYQAPSANLAVEGGNDYINLSMFSPKGRLGRIRYLAYSFVLGLLSLVAIFLIGLVSAGVGILTGASGLDGFAVGIVGTLLMIPVYVALLVCMVFLGIKRLHDIDWSGWLLLLQLVPIANIVIALLLMFMPGTKGPNQHGAQTPPNNTGLIIAAVLPPILGILALVGIAIPAYQEYVERAKAAQTQSITPSEQAQPAEDPPIATPEQ